VTFGNSYRLTIGSQPLFPKAQAEQGFLGFSVAARQQIGSPSAQTNKHQGVVAT
jgi:hypothetical protein